MAQLLSSSEGVSVLKLLARNYAFTVPIIFFTIIIASYLQWLSSSSGPIVKGLIARYRSSLEPTFMLRLRFVFNAVSIMNEGYYKFKDACYVVRRMDTDVTVVPLKYLDELRRSGLNELNATFANIHNVLGAYTNLDDMKYNDQFTKVISYCLNPNINELMKIAQDELNYSMSVDMPDFVEHEWMPVDIHTLLRRIISRVASRLMLGLPYCRNETMVSITESHTVCIFAVALILRRFPPILHPLVSMLIPYRWAILRNVRESKKIVGPILEKYLAAEAQSPSEKSFESPPSLFKWMVENAKPHQKTLHAFVSTQLAVTVTAVYTSSQVTSHLLVFLAANPSSVEELRREVTDSTDDLNNIESTKLPKMEACLAEALRLNPPLTNITLKDGVLIPKGALVAFPCSPMSLDPSVYFEPQQFKIRPENLASPVTTPTKKHLAFGWGSQAYPGRILAAKEIEAVAAMLIVEFDIDVAPGTEQMRRTYDIEDLRVMNPSMKILMRRRALK